MFRFIKKYFFIGLLFLSNLESTTPLSYISISNQTCRARPEIINFSSNNPVFYPLTIKTSKCGGNCNNVKYPYAKICVHDLAKDLNVKVFNLMSRTNEAKNIKGHETWEWEFRLDAIVCNNKQRWNKKNADANVKN